MKHLLSFALFLFSIPYLLACGGSSSSDVRYVAIGASDAAGIGALPPTDGYVYLIRDDIESCNGDVGLINLGIPGAKIDQFIDIELPAAIRAKPDLVTIWAGGNDITSGTSVEEFENSLARLLSELTSETSGFIIIGNLPNLTLLPRFRDDPDPDVTFERVILYNQAIARQASQYGIALVDLYSVGLTDSEVSDEDGFHPSNEGHRSIADHFLMQIEPIFCSATVNPVRNAG